MLRKNIVTACIVAAVVGSVLNFINSYDFIINSEPLSKRQVIKIILTYITPFCVSMYSSAKAQRLMTLKNN